jgi:hypothetical protein
MPANSAINSDVQKRCFALLLHAGYGKRSLDLARRDEAVLFWI